jgi:hypothetical protein
MGFSSFKNAEAEKKGEIDRARRQLTDYAGKEES